MSVTLVLWKTPVVFDPDEAEPLLDPYSKPGPRCRGCRSHD